VITEQQLRQLKPRHHSRWQWLALQPVKTDLRKVTIVFENLERIPHDEPVIFAMNHTDRYNYLPFMVPLWYDYRNIAPWVKGKYYQNAAVGKFLDITGCIPVPSRGYIITKDFQMMMHRRPPKTDYRLLRDWVDGKITADAFFATAGDTLTQYVSTPHGEFEPERQPYPAFIQNRYRRFMRLVTDVSITALEKERVSLLIFPEGTRSVRLTPGHPGIAQMALKTGIPVIPVGCNGSDKIYPGISPFAKRGTVIYRIGEPLTIDGELAPFTIREPFEPFSQEAEAKHSATFQAATDLIMARINNLLDPEYQFAGDTHGVSGDGAARFV